MHQDHNIPWKTLASHLKFIEENTSVTPHRTDLFPRDKATQGRELNYFVKAFAKTVEEFARTERSKYPTVFSKLASSWNDSTEKLAIAYAANDQVSSLLKRLSGQPEYADGLIALFEGDQMEPLLALANHHSEEMGIAHQEHFGRGYVWCGWVQLARYSIRAYIIINVIAETPYLIQDRRYQQLDAYKRLLGDLVRDSLITWSWHPHVRFLLGVEDRRRININELQAPDIFADANSLHEYLSHCFRTLYKYLMLANECGGALVPPYWENFVRHLVYLLFSPDRENPSKAGKDWKFV